MHFFINLMVRHKNDQDLKLNSITGIAFSFGVEQSASPYDDRNDKNNEIIFGNLLHKNGFIVWRNIWITNPSHFA